MTPLTSPLSWDSWIAALESDKYEQTEGGLRDKDKFCCLGVACDIHNKDGWIRDLHGDFFIYALGDVKIGGYLPDVLNDHLQLKTGEQEELARLNDSGKTFKEIAAHLRSIRGDR